MRTTSAKPVDPPEQPNHAAELKASDLLPSYSLILPQSCPRCQRAEDMTGSSDPCGVSDKTMGFCSVCSICCYDWRLGLAVGLHLPLPDDVDHAYVSCRRSRVCLGEGMTTPSYRGASDSQRFLA